MLLVEKELDSLFDLLSKLNKKGFKLTGSRYFGGVNDLSDWDFYGQYCNSNVVWLVGLGFVTKKCYDSPNIIEVFTNPLGIDVQLVRDVVLKEKIQQFIKCNYDFKRMTKEEKRDVWNNLTIFALSLLDSTDLF